MDKSPVAGADLREGAVAQSDRREFLAGSAACAAMAVLPMAVAAQERPVVVFAAASLKTALDEILPLHQAAAGVRSVASYGSSAALARQIEQGAPADIFISADREWMDYVAQRNLIRPETRADLVGNRLVLVAPRESSLIEVALGPATRLSALAGQGRIAIGETRAVPAGRYARSALETLGLWADVEQRLAQVETVRVALALVARGEAPLGIVYASDARAEPGVKVVGVFPETSHPRIVYPMAATRQDSEGARLLLAYLAGRDAMAVFERAGFLPLPGR